VSKKASGGKGKASAEDNRRKHPRVPLGLLVQVRSDSIDAFRAEHAVNLSVGGMFIKSAAPRPVGTQVFFQFTVKDGGTLIEGEGKVVHATAEGAEPMGMGVEFTSVLEPSRSIIRALVEARLAG
jgi:molecular chaperone DnaK